VDALFALQNRVSSPRLGGDVTTSQLADILAAGLRAPDHAQLRPWRFLTVSGPAREALGNLFAEALRADDAGASDAELDKIRAKPLRAPVIIVGICSGQSHPKVPHVEQLLSSGAAMHAMSLAAFALGLGAMWRTGAMAYHDVVRRGLGLADNEEIVGYLYLGEVQGNTRAVTPLAATDHVRAWP